MSKLHSPTQPRAEAQYQLLLCRDWFGHAQCA
jgi:hypothetical protein